MEFFNLPGCVTLVAHHDYKEAHVSAKPIELYTLLAAGKEKCFLAGPKRKQGPFTHCRPVAHALACLINILRDPLEVGIITKNTKSGNWADAPSCIVSPT